MYTDKNYQNKKEMKEDFKAGVKITVYQPGGIFPSIGTGRVTLEGPHYPKPHKWYASVMIKDDVVVKIIS